jgi:hypothetical protein
VGSSAVTAKPDTKSSIRAKVKGFMLVSIGRTPLQSPAIVSDFVPRSEMEFTAISYGVMSHSAQRHSRRLPELQVVVCEVGISSGRSIVDWCQGAAKGSRAAGIQEFGSVNCLELKAAGPARHECLHLSLTDELAEPHNVEFIGPRLDMIERSEPSRHIRLRWNSLFCGYVQWLGELSPQLRLCLMCQHTSIKVTNWL